LAYETAIRETLDENAHLADGDDCTLVKLNRVLSANAGVGQQEEQLKAEKGTP